MASPMKMYGSPKFAAELRRLMKSRGLSQRQLGSIVGVNHNAVSHWCTGRRLPEPQTAALLADYFDTQALNEFIHELLRITCDQCGKEFTGDRSRKQRFCQTECWARWHQQQRSIQRKAERADLLLSTRNENDMLRLEVQERVARVAKHCRACSGFVCYTPTCDLRPDSPLPLAKDVAA